MKELYLAGGCFWGMEAYFQKVKGVVSTQVGYANSACKNPTYEEVCSGSTNASETVKVTFDEGILSTEQVVGHFLKNIDPTQLNQQGHDVGTQYRSGIYSASNADVEHIAQILKEVQKQYSGKIVTEVLLIENFYPAEEYHQAYLAKNPRGYCHNIKAIRELMKSHEYNGK